MKVGVEGRGFMLMRLMIFAFASEGGGQCWESRAVRTLPSTVDAGGGESQTWIAVSRDDGVRLADVRHCVYIHT